MSLFNWFSNLFGDSDDITSNSTNMGVNPATGLPMMDDSMIDVGGNPYGTDLNDNSSTSVSTFNDDDFPTSTPAFDNNGFSSDDSFSSSGGNSFSAFDDDDSSFGGSGVGGFGGDGF